MRLAILIVAILLTGCGTGGSGGGAALDRGEMVQRLNASEVAAKRAEARIQVDQYDLGLRNSAAAAPGQTADGAARENASADALRREIKNLRRQLKGYRREQKKLHAQLGQ